MITLRQSAARELKLFVSMELQTHASQFVNSADLESHQMKFNQPNIIYLSIDNDACAVSGFFILAIESDNESIEFQRIVIDEKYRGIGQLAIRAMENYCRNVLNAKRIWLDVYADNLKGMHIYEKLGYEKFKECNCDERKLLFYQKRL